MLRATEMRDVGIVFVCEHVRRQLDVVDRRSTDRRPDFAGRERFESSRR